VQNQVSTNYGPQESGEATTGKAIFTHVFVLEKISRTSMPILIKLDTNHPCTKGIQVCSNKMLSPLQRRNNNTHAKIGWSHLKIFFARTTGPEKLRST
jgi:hypothetical protein